MNKAPKISVCIPTFNGERFIKKALESVLNQTLDDLEVIVSDDVSTDNTLDIVQQIASCDRRVKLLAEHRHLGLFRNFNRAIAAASGRYIKPLCHDDRLSPDALQTMAKVLDSNRGISLVVSARCLIDDSDTEQAVIRPFRKTRRLSARLALRETLLKMDNNIADPSSVCFHRVQGCESFNPNYLYLNLELWCRLLAHGDLYYVDEPLCYQRTHNTQSSRSIIQSHLYLADYLQAQKDLSATAQSVGISQSQWRSLIRSRIINHAFFIIQQGGSLEEATKASLKVIENADEELSYRLILRITECLQWVLREVLYPISKMISVSTLIDIQTNKDSPELEAICTTSSPAHSIEAPPSRALEHKDLTLASTDSNDSNKSIRLNLGCGNDLKPGYTNIDLFCDKPGIVKMDMRQLEFSDNYANEIFTNHSLEHIPHTETIAVLNEWYRVLKPGGMLHIRVPDMDWCLNNWLRQPEEDRWGYYLATIFGLQADAGQVHYTSFTQPRLKDLLQRVGFIDVQTESYWMPYQQAIDAKAFKPDSVEPSKDILNHCAQRLGLDRVLARTNDVFSKPLGEVNYDWIMDDITDGINTQMEISRHQQKTLELEVEIAKLNSYIKDLEQERNHYKGRWQRLMQIPLVVLLYRCWSKLKAHTTTEAVS